MEAIFEVIKNLHAFAVARPGCMVIKTSLCCVVKINNPLKSKNQSSEKMVKKFYPFCVRLKPKNSQKSHISKT